MFDIIKSINLKMGVLYLEELLNIKIENYIYEIRGKQVMLDSDLAKLYQCKNGTKTINLAVKRHINRFPERFMFQLTLKEYNNLKFQTETSSWNSYGGVRKLPYAFPEQGVAMLATIIKTSRAEEVSIAIMDAFVAMRHYINTNDFRILNIESKLLEHDKSIKKIEKVFTNFNQKEVNNEIYFAGEEYDAYSRIINILEKAQKELIIIDSYADHTLLDIIKRLKVKTILITKSNNLLTTQDINKYNKQYHNLKVIFNNTFHDRYFIIDNIDFYHCGASINRIGNKTFSINKINDNEIINLLLNKLKEVYYE